MYRIILPIRYFIKRRITCLAVIAVALCVFTVTVVMTVMNGLVHDFAEKNHVFVGDCIVGTDSLVGFAYYEDFLAQLQNTEFVAAAVPVIKNFGLVALQNSRNSAGLELMGIDPVGHNKVTNFAETLHYRRDEPELAFEPIYDSNLPGLIIGIDKMLERGPRGNYSQKPTLLRLDYLVSCFPLTPKGALVGGLSGGVNAKVFSYSDNSNSGLAKVDGNMFYLSFDEAQRLCGMTAPTKRTSAIFIKFKPDIELNAGTAEVAQMWRNFFKICAEKKQAYLLDNVTVQSWRNYLRDTIAPMEKEATMMMLLFIMVGIITVFIILVVFYMIISHKSKDIGILKSMGASNFSIIRLFLYFALLIGLAGAVIGMAAGCAFLARVNTIEDLLFNKFGWQVWNREVYSIGDIPNRLNGQLLAIIFVSAIAVSLIGALIPSCQAAKRKCIEILQVSQL